MTDPKWPESELNDGTTLMPAGAMIALLCGGCTWAQMQSPESGAAAMAPVVGGPFTAVGVLMFAIGLFRFIRSRAR